MRRPLALAVVLSALLALPPTALGAAPALADEGAGRFDSILEMDKVKPAGFDENSTENPYGQLLNQPFLLNAESELMVYRNKDNGNTVDLGWYDTRVDSGLNLGVDGKDANGFESTGIYGSSAVNVLKELYHVESVAFDPTGSGRKDHVAYIGHDASGEDDIVIVVVDTTQDNESATYRFEDNAGWLSGVEAWTGGNYIAITAGDYDGSGRETLVAHVLTNGDTYGLAQLSYDAGSNTITCMSERDKSLLHWKYVEENHGHELDDSTYEHDKMSADLATGDFNGDGIDDLAVVSYINGGARGRSWDCAYYFPMLNVAYGASDGGTVFDNQKSGFCQLRRENRDGDRYKMTAPAAPGIAAGDIDGDGVDEIVVAGSKNTITSKSNSYDVDVDHQWDIDGENWVIITLNAHEDGSFANPGEDAGTTNLSEVASNAWFAGGTGGEKCRSPLDVECVAMNGGGAAEYVFMGGALFDLSTSAPARLHTPGVFNEDDDGVGSQIVDEHYVQSVVAGNFDGNEWGYEQVMYVIVMKDRNQNDYYYRLGMIGGANYDGEGGPVGSQGGTDQTRFFDVTSDFIISNTGGGYHTNLVITPMDRDDDGVMARYTGKSYVYADPQVLTVLQMAPYFDEIDIGNDAGATTYAFTRTYEYTEGTSESKSYSIGGAFGVETPTVNVEVEAGYANSWTQSFENTLTRSVTDSFTAKAYDSVVLYRTPVFNYNYQLMSEDGTQWVDLEEAGLTISVPKTPTYVQMSVDDYNNFVDVYNAMMAEETADTGGTFTAMKKLDLDYLGQEGNPWGYANDMDQLSLNTYQLGYNGGETSSASTSGEATTETIEQETGFSFEISATTGANLGMFSVMAGVNYSLEEMSGHSTSKTTSSETETSGTVQDLDAKYLSDEYGIPEEVTRSYGFTWTLGKDEVDLGLAGKKALVVGYNVSNIGAPAPAVGDLAAFVDTETSASLTWSDPSAAGRSAIDGYHVYQKETDGTYRKLTESPLPKDALEYQVDGLASNTDYTFVVTSVSGNTESVWSNEATITTPKRMVPLTLDFDADEVQVTATHLGNVPIQSGESVPEETIVYIEVVPREGYIVTDVALTQVGEEPQSVNMADGAFNFSIGNDATVKVTCAKVVDLSEISYTSSVTDADGNVIGTVEAATEAGTPLDATGTVVSDPIKLTATPQEGYVLKEWVVTNASGEQVIGAVGNELTFTPYEDAHWIEAVFVPVDDPSVARTVTIPALTGGSVTVSDGMQNLTPDGNGVITVVRGTELTFMAMPDTYYRFAGWTDALESYEDEVTSVTLRVLDNLTVGASFEPDVLYMLEYGAVSEPNGGGTVTATANGTSVASGTGLVPETVVDLQATADQDSRFLKWGVTQGTVTTFTPVEEELVTESTHQITMSAKSSVDAYFKEIERFDLTVPANLEHGSIVVERAGQQVIPGDDALAFGDVITISATAEDGYLLTSLLVNGEEFASGESLTVKGDVSIEVTLEKVHVHAWSDEPTWAWGADNATAEATFACTDPDCGGTRTVSAQIASTTLVEPTCAEPGKSTLTATVSLDGRDYTTAVDVEVPAKGHDYQEGVCTVCGAEDPDYVAPEPPDKPGGGSDDGSQPGGGADGSGGRPDGGSSGNDADHDAPAVPDTGDASTALPLISALAGASVLATGIILRRRG